MVVTSADNHDFPESRVTGPYQGPSQRCADIEVQAEIMCKISLFFSFKMLRNEVIFLWTVTGNIHKNVAEQRVVTVDGIAFWTSYLEKLQV